MSHGGCGISISRLRNVGAMFYYLNLHTGRKKEKYQYGKVSVCNMAEKSLYSH